jgi:topoisomerase-4 subunit B
VKEVLDNSIDEYMMGFGKIIEITVNESQVKIRDYGRGIPLGKVIDVASKMNTGAKYDDKVFKKSVGLNGVGIKAVNALSSHFLIQSYRDNRTKVAEFSAGNLVNDHPEEATDRPNGTQVIFNADETLFGNYYFILEYLERMCRNYVFLNSGLTINFNGTKFYSENGLLDLLNENMSSPGLYPVIHLKEEDIEVAICHGTQYGEEYYAFVNGQHTTQGGTHLQTFREAYVKVIREFYKKEFDPSDIRTSIIAALSIKIQEPVFESQTKTKLGSKDIGPEGPSVKNFITDFLKKELDNFLHRNPDIAEMLFHKIIESEKERKAMASIKSLARERAKKVSLHNRKLRDCRIHFNSDDERRYETTIFITEGDSASGSITKSRDVNTQAVFTYGLTKKIVYENEEFNFLQAALDIEDGIENLRYNQVVIATDADVDGLHIRLLMITFILQFFPDLIKNGHLYILQTPLFRVRNKKKTIYCYNDNEREAAVMELGPNPEITRFKGLGEISPDEFKHFIGTNKRIEPVTLRKADNVAELLEFYMGKNTPERQDFIIDNLRIEEDVVEEV